MRELHLALSVDDASDQDGFAEHAVSCDGGVGVGQLQGADTRGAKGQGQVCAQSRCDTQPSSKIGHFIWADPLAYFHGDGVDRAG